MLVNIKPWRNSDPREIVNEDNGIPLCSTHDRLLCLSDVIVYCQNMLDKLDLDVDEIVNAKVTQNERKYPVEKARDRAEKYDKL